MQVPYADADEGFVPAAPAARARVVAKIHDLEETYELKMLIDTGADCCCIPMSAVLELEDKLGTTLPYDMVRVEGHDGRGGLVKKYFLGLEAHGIGESGEIGFVVIRSDLGIIGRDIVNNYAMLFDGPNSQWSTLVPDA